MKEDPLEFWREADDTLRKALRACAAMPGAAAVLPSLGRPDLETVLPLMRSWQRTVGRLMDVANFVGGAIPSKRKTVPPDGSPERVAYMLRMLETTAAMIAENIDSVSNGGTLPVAAADLATQCAACRRRLAVLMASMRRLEERAGG